MLQSLTDAMLKAAKTPKPGKRLEIADMRCPGLAFRVTDLGARSFTFRFRCPTSGRVNRMTLGRYPDLTLGKARQRADDLRGQVANGVNCGIRGKAASDSDGRRPPNPIQSGHRFRSKAATLLMG